MDGGEINESCAVLAITKKPREMEAYACKNVRML
jgi:hypothetical protein